LHSTFNFVDIGCARNPECFERREIGSLGINWRNVREESEHFHVQSHVSQASLEARLNAAFRCGFSSLAESNNRQTADQLDEIDDRVSLGFRARERIADP